MSGNRKCSPTSSTSPRAKRARVAAKASLTALPSNLLHLVLQFALSNNFHRLSGVCQRVSAHLRHHQSLEYYSVTLRSDAMCAGLTRCGLEGVQELNIGAGVTGAGLNLLNGPTSVKKISFGGFQGSHDRGLSFLTSFPNLEELGGFDPACDVGDEEVATFALLPALKKLDITAESVVLTDEGMASLGRIASLRSLELSGVDETVTSVSFTNLRHLSALQSLLIVLLEDDAAFPMEVPLALPSLTELNIIGGFEHPLNLSFSGDFGAFPSQSALQRITLSPCDGLTRNDLCRLCELNLSHLKLLGNIAFTEFVAALDILGDRAQNTNLVSLELQKFTGSGVCLTSLVSAYPSLTVLNLTNSGLGDLGLAGLACLANLSTLYIGGTQVTAAGRLAFGNGCASR